MTKQVCRGRTGVMCLLLVLLLPPERIAAQNPSGTVGGQISDPSGLAVPSAKVTAASSNGQLKPGVVHRDGSYEINGLAPGVYTVRATAKGFAPFEQQNVQVAPGKTGKVNIALKIAEEVEQVQVTSETTKVSVNPTENANALVIKGEDLQALSDDPDELQSELEALAGPSAGPNGGQIYVDGFTAGQLPPKADILEIRINQNPFSAEYDKLGYGRIEITTRPGSSQFHGQVMGDVNLSTFDSRNPFAVQEPAYHTDFFNGNVGGPLSKKASFFFSIFRRDIDDNSVIAASVLNPTTLAETSLNQAIRSPRTLLNLSPRMDFQLTPTNVLSVRYQFFDSNFPNSGVGQLNLASQALATHSDEHTVQVSDTQVFSAKLLNQIRFQYLHDDSTTLPQMFVPTISVLGAFTGGGNASGNSTDIQNHYEFQNLTSIFFGAHTLVVGGRLRDVHDSNTSNANFNGTFTFPSLPAYQAAEQTLLACANACTTAGPSQFLLVAGNPLITVNMLDAGLFAQDDWKLQPNMTLSLGLRWESQTGISDHSDFAPRLGFAWGLKRHKNSALKTVIRAGFGMFYDRFPETLILQSERLNGSTEKQYQVPSPDFYPNIPSISALSLLSASTPTRYQIDPHFNAPSTMQSALSLEQQVSKNATVSLTYLNSHGTHQLLTDDINAPLEGPFPSGIPDSAIRPYGDAAGNIYDYQSTGLFNQNQLIANFNLRLSNKLTLGGFYTLSYANADTNGNNGGFIMNPYDIRQDYGRAPFDVRNRVVIIGNWNLPHRFTLSPFVVAASGPPMNVTVGEDLFGTGVFNARPELGEPCASCPLGTTFITTPASAQSIIGPYGYDNPGQFTFNLRVSKTIGFGRETARRSSTGGGFGGGGGRGGGGGGPGGLGGRGLSGGSGPGGLFGAGQTSNRRFNLTLSLNARNVFNDVNLGCRIGTVGSSLFGQSNSIGGLFGGPGAGGCGGGGGGGGGLQAANRRIDFMAVFTF